MKKDFLLFNTINSMYPHTITTASPIAIEPMVNQRGSPTIMFNSNPMIKALNTIGASIPIIRCLENIKTTQLNRVAKLPNIISNGENEAMFTIAHPNTNPIVKSFLKKTSKIRISAKRNCMGPNDIG